MESGHSTELRIETRSNIFVMAALYADGSAPAPVRIRNLSPTGALIESNLLPRAGTEVRLSRASLGTSATIMWVEGSRAGLKFTAPIAIREWLPQGKRGIGQQFADELFHQKRLQSNDLPASVQHADILLQLKQSLARSSRELALDAAVAARHRSVLEVIDKVMLTLGSVANALAGNGEASSDED